MTGRQTTDRSASKGVGRPRPQVDSVLLEVQQGQALGDDPKQTARDDVKAVLDRFADDLRKALEEKLNKGA